MRSHSATKEEPSKENDERGDDIYVPDRGPRSVLWVVDVTTSQYSNGDLSCSPAMRPVVVVVGVVVLILRRWWCLVG